VYEKLAQQKKRRSGQEIYEELRLAILSSEISPGTIFNQVAIGEHFGVSRMPVRDALRRLEHDGLLERVPQGLRVRERSRKEIIQVYDAWALLEGEAAVQAAGLRYERDLATLEELLAQHEQGIGPGHSSRPDVRLSFHEAVWAAAHNDVLTDLLQRLNPLLVHTATSTLAQAGRWELALGEHRALVDAIREGRAEDAGHLARTHIRGSRDARLEMWREQHP
jgi:DNA-binding GntR family transcriptional regulator